MKEPNDSGPPEGFTGLWVLSSPTDGCKREIEYVAGKPNGRFRFYLPNGVVQREGSMIEGLYHGEMTVRNSWGVVLDVSHFEHGTGVYRIFMSSGHLGWEIPIRGGKKHGLVKRFDVHGALRCIEDYRDGQLVSTKDLNKIEGNLERESL
jgi:antitoxin component YwqK of YwqJK toxin-antitoxin module